MDVSDNIVDRSVQVQSMLKACMFTDLEENIVNSCRDFEEKILGEITIPYLLLKLFVP